MNFAESHTSVMTLF